MSADAAGIALFAAGDVADFTGGLSRRPTSTTCSGDSGAAARRRRVDVGDADVRPRRCRPPYDGPMTDASLADALGPLEAEILEVLWASGAWLSAPEIHEQLAATRPLAYTTVSTVLIRLWNKGHLERVRDGRAFAYRPVRNREQYTAARMAEMLTSIDDRPGALSWFLGLLDRDERAQLRRLLKRDDG